MNNRGYATSLVLVVILSIASLYLVLFYGKILNLNESVVKSGSISDEIVKDSNGKERLYSLLNENISFEGKVTYEDLDREYEIETVSEIFESKHEVSGLKDSIDFHINNRTDVNIEIKAFPIDSSQDYSYSITLTNNDKKMINKVVENEDFNEIIHKDEIYNIETGEVNYGDFALNISDIENSIVSATVEYDVLTNREILLTGGNLNKEIIIENEDSSIKIRYKEGGG